MVAVYIHLPPLGRASRVPKIVTGPPSDGVLQPRVGAHSHLSVHKMDVPRAGVTVFHGRPKTSARRRCFVWREGEGERGTQGWGVPLPLFCEALLLRWDQAFLCGSSHFGLPDERLGGVGGVRGEGRGTPECTPEPEDTAPVEVVAWSTEPPPARLCSTKRLAFIPQNGNLARNTSERLYKASNCLTAIILGGLTRLHGCSLRIPLQLKNSTHGPLRVGPRGLPPSRGSAVPQGRGVGGRGGPLEGLLARQSALPREAEGPYCQGNGLLCTPRRLGPSWRGSAGPELGGWWGMRKKTEGRRKQ